MFPKAVVQSDARKMEIRDDRAVPVPRFDIYRALPSVNPLTKTIAPAEKHLHLTTVITH